MRLISLLVLASLALIGLSSPSYAQAAPSMRDCSIASLSGSSQALFSTASQLRKYLLIQNNGNANVGVNLSGGTAAIAGAGTITLVPGATMEYPKSGGGNIIPGSSITVIGTAAQPLACIEGR